MNFVPRPCLSIAALAACSLIASNALAQPTPVPAKPPAPASKPPADEPLGPGKEAIKEKPDPIAIALAPQPDGLTFEKVSREAIATSPSVRGKEAELEGSQGAVTSSVVSFFPRLTLGVSYTRVSDVTGDGTGGGAILGALNEGPVTVGACPGNPAGQCVVDSKGLPVQANKFSFSSAILNQVAFTGNLTIPISDYFLRAVQAYNAADHNEESLKLATEAQRLAVSADAKLTLLNWILAKGQTIVTQQAVEQTKNQLSDAKALRKAEKGADADVLRIEALVAAAEFTEAEARAQETVAENRLRVIMHVPANRKFTIGVDIFTTPALPAIGSLDSLVAEAVRNRLEILSNEELKQAYEDIESTTNASYWPRLDGFANVLIADPNQRYFPQKEQFDTSWDIGLRLTWVVNDTFSTIGASAQARARTNQIDAQKQALIDAVRLEVTQAYSEIVKATPSIEAADKGVVSAEEALRITQLLFAVGSGTGTALVDAETAVFYARLRKLSAQVGVYEAIVRLDHATGRDRGMRLARKAPAKG